jgi:LPXTG-motif cell wall-anchored protein
MLDQLIVGTKASNDDFGASIKTRNIKDPVKKKITKTVPFSNALYDFTKINGEIYWEWRELEYVFEMIAPTPEILEEMKTEFSNYIMNVVEENIYDPYIPDYHFIGTYDSKSYDDDESGLKTTITVVFLAYPYKVANAPKVYKRTETGSFKVYNSSTHRVTPTITVAGIGRIEYKGLVRIFEDTVIVNDENNVIKLVTIGNEPGAALPSTGGPGTRLFTILGSILILGAGVLLWRRRRLI